MLNSLFKATQDFHETQKKRKKSRFKKAFERTKPFRIDFCSLKQSLYFLKWADTVSWLEYFCCCKTVYYRDSHYLPALIYVIISNYWSGDKLLTITVKQIQENVYVALTYKWHKLPSSRVHSDSCCYSDIPKCYHKIWSFHFFP